VDVENNEQMMKEEEDMKKFVDKYRKTK